MAEPQRAAQRVPASRNNRRCSSARTKERRAQVRQVEHSASDLVVDEFWRHLHAGELAEAYALTTERYRRRTGFEAFAELVRKHPVLQTGEKRGVSSGSGGDRHTSGRTLVDADGKHFLFQIELRREDSLWHPEPPPFRVDEFTTREGGEGR